jgi:hypothetical protein
MSTLRGHEEKLFWQLICTQTLDAQVTLPESKVAHEVVAEDQADQMLLPEPACTDEF